LINSPQYRSVYAYDLIDQSPMYRDLIPDVVSDYWINSISRSDYETGINIISDYCNETIDPPTDWLTFNVQNITVLPQDSMFTCHTFNYAIETQSEWYATEIIFAPDDTQLMHHLYAFDCPILEESLIYLLTSRNDLCMRSYEIIMEKCNILYFWTKGNNKHGLIITIIQ
jgi:hypothetical protein